MGTLWGMCHGACMYVYVQACLTQKEVKVTNWKIKKAKKIKGFPEIALPFIFKCFLVTCFFADDDVTN